eukprot:Lithocolla_globosa_v1_NODE_706_length_3411_cov_5.489425.p2 type:complete len:373 gc:universal NODE_706_length_3411_cov_5.489425:2200-3318(+)
MFLANQMHTAQRKLLRTCAMRSFQFAVAFDVDGVLYSGGPTHPIAGAVKTVQKLWNHPSLTHPRIPHVFLTNGTGKTEKDKAEELESFLSVPIMSSQVVLASSPMQDLAEKFSDDLVMFVSSSREFSEKVGALYGFKRVTTHQEYSQLHPVLVPNKKKLLKKPFGDVQENTQRLDEEAPVKAIFLLGSPDDWQIALQVCLDILRSKNGQCGFQHESDDGQTTPLYSGNPDLDYADLHTVPRLTLGAFRMCLEKLYFETLGRQLNVTLFGKPYPSVYDYAELALKKQAKMMGCQVKTIYAIGDNPKSDVKGANGAGEKWVSILTRTGNFKGETGQNDPDNPAKFVCQDVAEAWEYIEKREGLLQGDEAGVSKL